MFKSRAHRDKVNAKVLKDPRLARMAEWGPMPFVMKRMVYSGFMILVDASARCTPGKHPPFVERAGRLLQ